MRLANNLEKNKLFLFYDNYFSLPEPAVYLKQDKGTFDVSTPDGKHCRNCPLPSKKAIIKNEGKSLNLLTKIGS